MTVCMFGNPADGLRSDEYGGCLLDKVVYMDWIIIVRKDIIYNFV